MRDETVSDDDRSRVVFLGDSDSEAGREQVRDAVAARFNLGAAALARLFAGPPVVVKSDLDAETAWRYKLAIEETGAKCRIETMPAENDTDALGYLERRRGERRERPDRRSRTRADTLVPDRREGDRRNGQAGED